MISLEEHDSQRIKAEHSMNKDPHPNGIECPVCKKELWDSSPTVMLYSYPSQKHIHCPECGYKGYRIS